MELPTAAQREQLARVARARNWGPALVLAGWLHLGAFLVCYYLTVVEDYHDAPGYLLTWGAELAGGWLIFRLCAGPRRDAQPRHPLHALIRHVWITYLVLAFNLASMNTLRGHAMFELFPATATLASFAFVLMALLVHPRFYAAVLLMFASGLLMAAYQRHAFLISALAWWLVLNATGLSLWRPRLLGRERRGTSGADRVPRLHGAEVPGKAARS